MTALQVAHAHQRRVVLVATSVRGKRIEAAGTASAANELRPLGMTASAANESRPLGPRPRQADRGRRDRIRGKRIEAAGR